METEMANSLGIRRLDEREIICYKMRASSK
jgi:hypothetical protein